MFIDYDKKMVIKNFENKNTFHFSRFIKSFNAFLETLKYDLLLLYPDIKINKHYSKLIDFFAHIE
jgi:hypothetical protein